MKESFNYNFSISYHRINLSSKSNSAHASAQNSNDIIDLARTQVSQHFDYVNDRLETTGAITDKGSYYEIPAYESAGAGGLKIIKVYKSSGKVTFEDNDTHKTENAGHINLKRPILIQYLSMML